MPSHQRLIKGFSHERPVMMKVFLCHVSSCFITFFFFFFFRLATQSSITLTASPGYEKVLNRPTTAAAFPSRRTIRSLPPISAKALSHYVVKSVRYDLEIGLVFKDLSMMYRALWDRRHEGATRISQCTRRVAPSALTYPSGPFVPPISQCTIHHA